jgi:mannose-6-phosphate isomerase-like protein (cupin superfamily)
MSLTTAGDAVRHETPNAVMRTLAAPSTGASELSVWEVAMRAGQAGPVHFADREQVWLVIDGELHFELGDEPAVGSAGSATDRQRAVVRAGDAIAVAGGAERRVTAPTEARAIVSSPAAPHVSTPETDARPLPWAL